MLFDLSPQQNIDAPLTRYLSLLSEHDIIGNEMAETISKKIIADLLFDQISVIRKDLQDRADSGLDSGEYGRPLFDYVPETKLKLVDVVINKENLETRFTKERAKKVLSAILKIYKPKASLDVPPPLNSATIQEVVNDYLKNLNND